MPKPWNLFKEQTFDFHQTSTHMYKPNNGRFEWHVTYIQKQGCKTKLQIQQHFIYFYWGGGRKHEKFNTD